MANIEVTRCVYFKGRFLSISNVVAIFDRLKDILMPQRVCFFVCFWYHPRKVWDWKLFRNVTYLAGQKRGQYGWELADYLKLCSYVWAVLTSRQQQKTFLRASLIQTTKTIGTNAFWWEKYYNFSCKVQSGILAWKKPF